MVNSTEATNTALNIERKHLKILGRWLPSWYRHDIRKPHRWLANKRLWKSNAWQINAWVLPNITSGLHWNCHNTLLWEKPKR